MPFDFHTHTTLSDGSLSPLELIRRLAVLGYEAVALTDHAGPGGLETILKQLAQDCALAERFWGIGALPGIELTHVPAAAIDEVAQAAKRLGALVVVVHGETPVEPVEPGTNWAAIRSPHVDILAHPGLITLEQAHEAAATGTYLELTSRAGHCLTNGHVARLARLAGAKLMVNSDAHHPSDLLSANMQLTVALGAGLSQEEATEALQHSRAFAEKIRK